VAFLDAWERCYTRIHALCRRWVGGDPQDAEDVLGRVALRAVEDIASRDDVISSYPAWLTRLAWNTAMDLHRERACRRHAVERYLEMAGAEGAREVESVESEHIRAEQYIGLRAAVEKLPLRLREVSERRFLDEMPYEEIAEELAITNENVRKRIQEARAILGRRLAGGEHR